MTSDRLFYLFINFVQQLPSLLALLACIVFAVTRWKRYPKVAMVVTIGLGLLLVHAIVFLFVYNFVPTWFIRSAILSGSNYEERETVIRNVYLVLGLISNSAAAVAFAVLVAGIFMGRKPTNELRET
ncbi:MAG TPA: hypothetical protein VFZ40_16220 [Pyrinomonadaceae bacterium]